MSDRRPQPWVGSVGFRRLEPWVGSVGFRRLEPWVGSVGFRRLEIADRAADERAAYVHVPFCRRRCPYCDFAVVDLETTSPSIESYVDALVAEIAMEEEWLPLHAVNLGGGTPSALEPEQIEKVIGALSTRFGIVDHAEVSIEANPEDWTRSYAERLLEAGVTRVSLGVQSFDNGVLQVLGRSHTAEQAAEAVVDSHAAGFRSVNVDLIFGTPGESMESWRATVDAVLDLEPEHLSAYGLTVELGTALSRAVAGGAAGPDDDDQADKYEWLCTAAAPRYDHYEVSNWSKPGLECRYNMITWAQGEYLGFGLGAHGHRHGERGRNVRRLDVYLEMIQAGERPRAGREKLDLWEREKERVFLGLRRRVGVVAGEAGAAFLQSEAGARLAAAGVVAQVGDRLVVQNPLLTDAVAREVLALEHP